MTAMRGYLNGEAGQQNARPENNDNTQGAQAMSGYSRTDENIPWWKEPTKDQWYAYCAAWMGWTLDAFDFTVFLLIMAPFAQEFGVPLIDVTAVFSVTLIMGLGR